MAMASVKRYFHDDIFSWILLNIAIMYEYCATI